MIKTKDVSSLSLFLFVIFTPAFSETPLLHAQTTQGNILGTVTDDSGAFIVSAEVTVTSLDTGSKRVTSTDKEGFYDIAHLEPGNYQVAAHMTGFRQFIQSTVVLESAKKVRIDITLKIGEVSQTVEVQGVTPPIDTETARIAEVAVERTLRNTPLGGRSGANFLIGLMPGVYAAFGGGGYTMHGSRGGATFDTIDGVYTGFNIEGRMNATVRPDQEALKEVRVESVNASAEFSRSAVVTQTTKSGTNDLHGQATWNYQNPVLDAKDFFAPQRPRGLPINNVFVNAGGPVIIPGLYDGRNKTFFFVHLDGQEMQADAPFLRNVPTLAMRSGDFSALGTIRDPLSGQPFPGNIIPPERLNRNAVKYMERFYPLPTENLATPANNFVKQICCSGRSDRAYDFRGDQLLTSSNTLFGRIFWNDFKIMANGPPPDFAGYNNENRIQLSAIVGDTHVFSPNLINEFRLGFYRRPAESQGPLNGKEVVDDIGLTGYPYPLPSDVTALPSVAVTGLVGVGSGAVTRYRDNNYNLVDNITIAKGKHTFKTGFDLRKNNRSEYPASPSAQFGGSTYDGFVTGQPFADFLLGIPRNSSRSLPISPYYGSNTAWAAFFQTDWRVTPRLTLNLGIRYDRAEPWVEEQDRVYNFDPTTGSIVIPTSANAAMIHPLFPKDVPVITASQAGFPERSLIKTDANDLAPRVGFAWRTGLKDVVVRGGYGLYYSFEASKGFPMMIAGPFVATETFDNQVTNGTPLWQWPQMFPTNSPARPLATQDVFSTLVDLRNSYLHQWNLSLEKQIGEYGLRLSYIGSSTLQLPYRHNINQPPPSTIPFNQNRRPYPYLRNVIYYDGGGTASYNAFEVQLIRRFAKGVSLNVHYNWSKNLSNSDDVSSLTDLIENNYDRAREKTHVGYDIGQRFVTYLEWELPFGRGRRFLADAHSVVNGILGGWVISTYWTGYSGPWLTPVFSGSDPSNTNVIGGRPDRLCDGNRSNPDIVNWFDTSCFVAPLAGSGRFGNSGKRVIQAPGNWGTNTSLFKYFKLTEKVDFRIQAMFYNILNHPQFQYPDLNLNSPTASRIRATTYGYFTEIWSSRRTEVGIRFGW